MIRIATFATLGLLALNLSGAVQAGWAKGWSVQALLNNQGSTLNAALSARTALLDALNPRDAAGPRR